jgi:hypothetical protein
MGMGFLGAKVAEEFVLALQIVIGAIFLGSFLTKLLEPLRFARSVEDYDIASRPLAFTIALCLLPLEAFLAVTHLTGWLVELAAPIVCGVLIAFIAVVSRVLASGRVVACHCFGAASSDVLSARTVGRLTLMLLGECVIVVRIGVFSAPLSRSVFASIRSVTDALILLGWVTSVFLIGAWLSDFGDLLCLLPQSVLSRFRIGWDRCIATEE